MKKTIHTVEFEHLSQTFYADCDVTLQELAYHESPTGKSETVYCLDRLVITDALGNPIENEFQVLIQSCESAIRKEEDRLNAERFLL